MREVKVEMDKSYRSWISELKKRYRATQIKAAVSVNRALLEFYWFLGKDISEKYPGRRRNVGFFEKLSEDLRLEIPNTRGFSPSNSGIVSISTNSTVIFYKL